MKKRTNEEYIKELAEKNPNTEALEQYVSSNVPILHRCIIHDEIWKTTPSRALQGVGCPKCKKNRFHDSRCRTQQQYINEVEKISADIVVIGNYVNARTPIEHYCKKHKVIWNASPESILHGCGCPSCGIQKSSDARRMSHEEYVSRLEQVNINIEVIGTYHGAETPILHRCKIDGYEWNAAPGNTLSGKGCPKCAGNLKLTNEEYIDKLKIVNPYIKPLGEYINSTTKIPHMCLIDGCVWETAPYSTLSGYGCPQCHETKGERQIRQWLELHNIEYTYQKTFIDCRDIKVLPFDFYIPKYHLCIEYDGEQHFEPINFSGEGEAWALQNLEKTQRHDKIKNQYCSDNNIHLLRIPYYKNITEELENFFIHLI